MKKIVLATALFTLLLSCSNSNEGTSATDTTGTTNPTAIDTTQHPTGITNSNVISTDTAAMNVENTNPAGRDSVNRQ